jgi:hypothetical protein
MSAWLFDKNDVVLVNCPGKYVGKATIVMQWASFATRSEREYAVRQLNDDGTEAPGIYLINEKDIILLVDNESWSFILHPLEEYI